MSGTDAGLTDATRTIVDEALTERLRATIGTATRTELGEVTALLIRRYARAIGERNALYLDEGYARAAGYPGLVAPPNMLNSIVEWAEGADYDQLRDDGTSAEEIPGLSGVKFMGGGERMEFHAPVVAGDRISLHSKLIQVDGRQTKSGLMVVLHYRNVYEKHAGLPVMTCTRTILVR
jgi:acyl dehydratase